MAVLPLGVSWCQLYHSPVCAAAVFLGVCWSMVNHWSWIDLCSIPATNYLHILIQTIELKAINKKALEMSVAGWDDDGFVVLLLLLLIKETWYDTLLDLWSTWPSTRCQTFCSNWVKYIFFPSAQKPVELLFCGFFNPENCSSQSAWDVGAETTAEILSPFCLVP